MRSQGSRRARLATLWQWCGAATRGPSRRVALFAAALVASGFATLPMAIAHAETSGSQMVIVPADAAPEITEVADLVLEVSPMVLAIGNLDGSLIAEGGKRFRLDANVLFRFDSADLTGPADAVLDDLVSQLKAGGAKSLRVDGYTDQVGDSAYNQRLSLARARTVQDRLERALGAAVRIEARGHGEADPVADNATKTGQARNRRVTVTVLS